MDTCPYINYDIEDIVNPEGEIVDIEAKAYCEYHDTDDFDCAYCSKRTKHTKKNYFDEREDYSNAYLDR